MKSYSRLSLERLLRYLIKYLHIEYFIVHTAFAVCVFLHSLLPASAAVGYCFAGAQNTHQVFSRCKLSLSMCGNVVANDHLVACRTYCLAVDYLVACGTYSLTN